MNKFTHPRGIFALISTRPYLRSVSESEVKAMRANPLDALCAFGVNSCAHHWRNDYTSGIVRDSTATSDVLRRVRSCAAGEVEGVGVEDGGGADDVGGECWDDVEEAVFNVGVVR